MIRGHDDWKLEHPPEYDRDSRADCARCGAEFGPDEFDVELCAPCEVQVEANEWDEED